MFVGPFAGGVTIGGTRPKSSNVISQCGLGVYLSGGTGGNVVERNYMGSDATGTVSIANFISVAIAGDASPDSIGKPGFGNQIVGSVAGVAAEQSGGVAGGGVIQGNLIGLTASGRAALPNVVDGVVMEDKAAGYLIGGTAAGAGNVISGNGQHGQSGPQGYGIEIDQSSGGLIEGNRIGLAAMGSKAISNAAGGHLPRL